MTSLLHRSALALSLGLLFAAPTFAQTPSTEDGLIKVRSAYSMDETVARIRDDVAAKGIMFFQAVDSFAEGSQDERARYEAERAQVLNGAHVDHRVGLTQAVQATSEQGKADAAQKSREVFKMISRGDRNSNPALVTIGSHALSMHAISAW